MQSTPATPKTEPAAAPVNIRREIREDGICILTFDRPESSANLFDAATLEEFGAHIDFLESDRSIRGLVIASAKENIYIAGADLRQLGRLREPGQLREFITSGQSIMERLSKLPFPTVAAIHGAAVGGGYEMALACDYRVASDDRSTRIGLPETQLGILPAWGGATRLPRLIGLPAALSVALPGKVVPARQARKLGMIDEMVPRERLLEFCLGKLQAGKPARRRHLLNNWLSARVIAMRARRMTLKKTRGNYPAPLCALEVMSRGLSKPIEESLKMEADAVVDLAQGEQVKNLIGVFFLQERAKKLKGGGAPVSTAAVIGAGVMGAGIAQWLSARGIRVILQDISKEQLSRGMVAIQGLYKAGEKRKLFTQAEAQQGMDRISPIVGEAPLGNVDLAIEAAVEKLEVKQKLFRRVLELAPPDALLATNTSAISIAEIAPVNRLVGLHFFNPVHKMKLVEIVTYDKTSAAAKERAVAFAHQIGKLPVLVKDSPGFLVNRVLMPYLIESCLLVMSGVAVKRVDEAMLDFGMPMGPLRLLDEVGIDIALDVAETLTRAFSPRLETPGILRSLVEAGCRGRKNGRGFYLHGGKKATVNPLVAQLAGGSSEIDDDSYELQSRMALLMVNEGARCLEEQVAAAPEDVDLAMVLGTGFAPFRGGPMRYADSLGAANVVRELETLADNHGERFIPCDLLQQMAADGRAFYGGENEA